MAEYTFDEGIYIDSVKYEVPVLAVDVKPSTLWKYAERTEDGIHNGEILGVYMNYTISCGSIVSQLIYKELLDKITEPVEYHIVKLPNQYGEMEDMEVYFSVDSYAVRESIAGVTSFKGLKFECISRKPTRK